MASRRMIPTRFFKDPDILALSSKDVQLILVGLTLEADDEGREVAHAGLLGRAMDYAPEIIEHALIELEVNDLLQLYHVGKHRYYFLTRWNEWQTLGTKKRPSRYPAPPVQDQPNATRPDSENGNLTSPHHMLKTDTNVLAESAGKRWQLSSQENQTESNGTDEEQRATEQNHPQDQLKVIPFPVQPLPTAYHAKKQALSCREVTQQCAAILQLEVSEALLRLVAEYADHPSLSLLGEADAAREWIDDKTRNRSGKRLTVAFFRRWLQREQERATQRLRWCEDDLAATGTTGRRQPFSSPAPYEGRSHLPSLMHLADQDQHARGGQN